jgi:quaternary ammonium compound-resistance protein SugE
MTTHEDNISTKRAWIMLLLAGTFEIVYALSVAGSNAFSEPTWSISAVVFFLLTLYALSVALKKIDVGIGYAVWAGIGAVGSVVFGSIIFGQSFTFIQTFWLAVIIGGVIWLKLASSEKSEPDN